MGRINTFVFFNNNSGNIQLWENGVEYKIISYGDDLTENDTKFGNFIIRKIPENPNKIRVFYQGNFWKIPRIRICSAGILLSLDNTNLLDIILIFFFNVVCILTILFSWDDTLIPFISVGIYASTVLLTIFAFKDFNWILPDEIKYL